MWIRRILPALLVLGTCAMDASAGDLPDGFVYLRDVAPDIRQDMRYASRQNFMRKRLPGYDAGECVLTSAAANALARVQAAAARSQLTLVVFDCYRPQRAVDAMVAWVRQGKGTDPAYHPNVPRSQLIAEGYIGAKSSHARGSTVDLGYAFSGTNVLGAENVCDRRDEQTADFGTPFDCFDPASRTASQAVAGQAREARKSLVALMRQQGFKNYPGEWWHFTLQGEPFANRSFDFVIEPR
ncbi:M15 family metallopeptidase [Roseibium sp. M-1]